MLQSVLLGVHILIALSLIGLILMQHGKGADAGAAFGSGASSTVFGSQGSASFLTKTTTILAAAFFINCFVLAWLSSQQVKSSSLMERVAVEELAAPAAPVPADMPVVADTPAETPAVPAETPVAPEEPKVNY